MRSCRCGGVRGGVRYAAVGSEQSTVHPALTLLAGTHYSLPCTALQCTLLRCFLLQYLEMIDDVMRNGVLRGDRTGTGTYSKFGTSMRFDLRHSFPLLTSKRVFWRGE